MTDIDSIPPDIDLDEPTAERLLTGASFDGLTAAHAALAGVLSAASAPPQPSELTGEGEARAMFSTVHGARGRRGSRGRTAVAGAVLAGVLLLGGGTAAARAGRLPDPVQHAVHGVLAKAGVSIPDEGGSRAVPMGEQGSTGGTASTGPVPVSPGDPATPTTQATPPHPTGTGPGTGQTVCTVTSGGQCNPDPGRPTNPGSPGNPTEPSNPHDPGKHGQPTDVGKPTDPKAPVQPKK